MVTHVNTIDIEVWRLESQIPRGVDPDGIDDLVRSALSSGETGEGRETSRMGYSDGAALLSQEYEPLVVGV